MKQNDISSVTVLLDENFGKDRQSKTAYRLRDAVSPLAELCFVVRIEGKLEASLQFWPIEMGEQGAAVDALLLGPIAVSQEYRGQGLGLKLMEHGLNIARKLGHSRVILVGDESYYKKVGFSRKMALHLEMPGPVDKERLLAQELVPGAMQDVKGMISKIK
ncbi:MAG: N-acetyltransferase [Emcibacter sp.]|nr:N-acetyltransferase [Emcibacter sp.]